MISKQTPKVQNQFFRLYLVALIALMATWLPAHTNKAQAATLQPVLDYGYLWNLEFNFDNDFRGILIVEVGPWGNGDLLAVEETSVSVVECFPVGDVKIIDGAAVFPGNGYLKCSFDIGDVVRKNHKLKPNNPDTYGSIIMSTKASLVNDAPAPIFYHPDAVFRLDPVGPNIMEMITDLSNGNGAMSTVLSTGNWNDWQGYTSDYICTGVANCNLTYTAGPASVVLNSQGNALTFATGPTSFSIGMDSTGYLNGRIDTLRIDPGNFAH